MMKYYILLITILLSSPATAHEWKQDYWLENLLRNHIKLIDCWTAVNDEDIVTFRSQCSLWTMGYTENKAMIQYDEARAVHPDLNELEFLALHFMDTADEELWGIYGNVTLHDRVVGIMAAMHIAEGLTRNDK